MNCRNALTLILVASTTAPLSRGTLSFNTCVLPSSPKNSILPFPAEASETVVDFSLERKSFPSIEATLVLESLDHLPIECGLLLA